MGAAASGAFSRNSNGAAARRMRTRARKCAEKNAALRSPFNWACALPEVSKTTRARGSAQNEGAPLRSPCN